MLLEKVFRFGQVYHEYLLKGIFFEQLKESLQQSMQKIWEKKSDYILEHE